MWGIAERGFYNTPPKIYNEDLEPFKQMLIEKNKVPQGYKIINIILYSKSNSINFITTIFNYEYNDYIDIMFVLEQDNTILSFM